MNKQSKITMSGVNTNTSFAYTSPRQIKSSFETFLSFSFLAIPNKNLLLSFFFVFIIITSAYSQNGKKIFNANCVACHTIGKGPLVGPDLKGVTGKHTEDWLLKWVRSSQSMIKNKDPQALALYNQNNQIVMPDQPFSDDQIKALLDFIKTGSSSDAIAKDNKGADKKSVSDSSGNIVAAGNSNPPDNKTVSSSSVTNQTNETSQQENKGASISSNTGNNADKADESRTSNPDRMFLYTGISIVLLFFLGILITMVMVIKVLLTALGKKYEKELSK